MVGEEVGTVRVEPCVQDSLDDRAVLIACMIVLDLTGLAGLVRVAKESDKTEKTKTPCESRFLGFRISSTSVEEIEGLHEVGHPHTYPNPHT